MPSLEYFRGAGDVSSDRSPSWVETDSLCRCVAEPTEEDLTASDHAVKTEGVVSIGEISCRGHNYRVFTTRNDTRGRLTLSSPHVANSPIPALLEDWL